MFNRLYPFKQAPTGQILLNQNDHYIRQAVERYGEFSEAEVDLFKDVLLPSDMVVEVGANFGCHTLALSQLAGQVVAFEPQPLIFQVLCANLALNSITNVRVQQKVVTHSSGHTLPRICPVLDPKVYQNFGSLSLLDEWEQGELVEEIALDELGLKQLDFLKLDCEGGELDVLRGAYRTIARFHPWIYLEFTSNRAALLSLLEELGYVCLRHLPSINRFPNHLSNTPQNQDDSGLASDMLFCFHKNKPPRDSLRPPFGSRHSFFTAKDEELLGMGPQPVGLVEGIY